MRAEDDRAAVASEVEYRVLERLGIHRIEAAERLVENHQRRVVQHGAGELHLLLHAAGKILHLGRAPILPARTQAEPFEPVVDATVGILGFQPLEAAEEAKDAAHLHLAIEAALLGEIPKAIGDRRIAIRTSQHLDAPRIGDHQVEDHADSRRLAGPIGTQQAEDRPCGDEQRHVAHGKVIRVRLAHVFDANGNRRCRHQGRPGKKSG